MANEAKIKELVKKRASIKAKLTQFISFLANAKSYEHLSDTQLLELELRLRKLESSYSAYDEFQSELEIISDSPEELYADREQFESQYYSQTAAARNLIAVNRKLSQQRSDSASEVGSATRAVHLELVSDLSKEAFIAALGRFTARRGKPNTIFSDNGPTFGELVEGALVVIKEKNTPPLMWLLGRIERIVPGNDGVARVADIRTKKGVIRRAFNSICCLPISSLEDKSSTPGVC
ncbi:hypothetical protein K1T71_015212 [Dendrolimus kikuchii]|nr:hypothetical protein K1T71_015212 [Dendrolimus kikuchii]